MALCSRIVSQAKAVRGNSRVAGPRALYCGEICGGVNVSCTECSESICEEHSSRMTAMHSAWPSALDDSSGSSGSSIIISIIISSTISISISSFSSSRKSGEVVERADVSKLSTGLLIPVTRGTGGGTSDRRWVFRAGAFFPCDGYICLIE